MNGCSTKDDDSFVRKVFQTNGASEVREHTFKLQKSIVKYYEKLNKRNPNHSSKLNTKKIINDINKRIDTVSFDVFTKKKNITYKEYLNVAFSKSYVKNRNDYLIAGIYKMLYFAYAIDRSHTITTMQYDIEKIQEANKMMQIIQYRIQTDKNKDGDFLFLTWQRPWQIDLLKNINKKKEIDLEKYTKKDLMYHSNMSFQVITTGMIFTLQETLRYLGSESTNLSSEAIKSVFVFL